MDILTQKTKDLTEKHNKQSKFENNHYVTEKKIFAANISRTTSIYDVK